ncbi:hypothetical protein FB567DRAFT_591847 [Paraphoma chrysanthemicola]|uniref:Uncharacterized protein n=1 Tax=Paraphoma chrysanthemicola TaxID=798071 RepID=A0A8K0RAC2_9PLEO|nr:hypothetical protein FB567DRAFT_591847 [Paraphoma chrysanthemicola]
MAAIQPPPPPPPGGNGGPGKGPSHNSPPSNKSIPRRRARLVRGDGKSAQTAWWTDTLWAHVNQKQFMVHRRTNALPNRWVRTTEGEARYDAEMGFTVWELGAGAARRVNLVGDSRFEPFQWQIAEVQDEERARVARHELLPGEENIFDDVEEEYIGQDPSPFDSPFLGKTSSPSSGGARGHRTMGSTSSAGIPQTPSRRGNDQTSSPLNASSSPGGRGTGTQLDRGVGSSPRQGPSSPMSPSAGKGRRGGGPSSPTQGG